jgi:quercetin dioxygenase-like cupin family protein
MSSENEINNLIGNPHNLANLVDYQKDAVVSKTIVAKKTGTVTLFAFDQQQGLSEHSAPYDAIVYILDRSATVTINGKDHITSKGEMIILPANVPHALQAKEKFKMLLIMIKSQ